MSPSSIAEHLLDSAVDGYAASRRLSGQERRLLAATVSGRVEKEIASSLHCTRSTTSTYWQRIFRKTGCHSQLQVVTAVLRWIVDQYLSATSGHDYEHAVCDGRGARVIDAGIATLQGEKP